MANKTDWTGERLETHIYNENTVEHLHRYAVAMRFVKNKRVLDLACGEGYGSNLLCDKACEVVGVDIDSDTIELAKKKYAKSNLTFKVGSASKVPHDGSYFDIVVSFETIEHHDKHNEMMLEIKRVLKDDGLLIISSPDKLYYTDKRGVTNPFHVKELYADEFENLLRRYFSNVKLTKQKSFYGSLIYSEKLEGNLASVQNFTGDFNQVVESDDLGALYLIAFASNSKLPIFDLSLFNGEKIFDQILINKVEAVRNSRSYRLGNLILKPFRFIKRLIG